jgi:hypothetical protein
MLFTEYFLHYIWKFRLFDHNALQTVDGDSIEIYSVGMHNTDSGPDVESHLWKFMRLRPQNFPTIRLAQFAALVVNANHLFSKGTIYKRSKGFTKFVY